MNHRSLHPGSVSQAKPASQTWFQLTALRQVWHLNAPRVPVLVFLSVKSIYGEQNCFCIRKQVYFCFNLLAFETLGGHSRNCMDCHFHISDGFASQMHPWYFCVLRLTGEQQKRRTDVRESLGTEEVFQRGWVKIKKRKCEIIRTMLLLSISEDQSTSN